jgi:hypothetical protein
MVVRRAVLPGRRSEPPVAAAQAQSVEMPPAVLTAGAAAVRLQLATALRAAPTEVAAPAGKAERTAPMGAAQAGRLVGGEWSAAREAWPRRPVAVAWSSAEERRAERQAGLPLVAPAGADSEGRVAE